MRLLKSLYCRLCATNCFQPSRRRDATSSSIILFNLPSAGGMSAGLAVGVCLHFLAGGGVAGGCARLNEGTGAGDGDGIVDAMDLFGRGGESKIGEGVRGSAVME